MYMAFAACTRVSFQGRRLGKGNAETYNLALSRISSRRGPSDTASAGEDSLYNQCSERTKLVLELGNDFNTTDSKGFLSISRGGHCWQQSENKTPGFNLKEVPYLFTGGA